MSVRCQGVWPKEYTFEMRRSHCKVSRGGVPLAVFLVVFLRVGRSVRKLISYDWQRTGVVRTQRNRGTACIYTLKCPQVHAEMSPLCCGLRCQNQLGVQSVSCIPGSDVVSE